MITFVEIRNIIRKKLAEGESKEEIIDDFYWLYKNKLIDDEQFPKILNMINSDLYHETNQFMLDDENRIKVLSPEEYNNKVDTFGTHYHELNRFVMEHTIETYNTNDVLSRNAKESISEQELVRSKIDMDIVADGPTENIEVTNKLTLTAAKAYKDKKVGVLVFGNNHTPGGNVFVAGTQQETICRCSTLYPCLQALEYSYYDKNRELFEERKLSELGNDDLIYTPNVTIFKSDDSAPKMLDEKDWYNVDMITAAAPAIIRDISYYQLEKVLTSRITRIIEVAKAKGIEVLVLGAFGCGGLNNPPLLVASIFKRLLKKYKFEKVEFAIFDRNPNVGNYKVFKDILE